MARPIQVADNLFYGSLACCRIKGDFAIVHACKDPCHRKTKAIETVYEIGSDLYLDMVDADKPKYFDLESFRRFLDFTDRHIKDRPVLIHCNKGGSRAPSLALLYMAKRLGTLPNGSYNDARHVFKQAFNYRPNKGIAAFLTENWGAL